MQNEILERLHLEHADPEWVSDCTDYINSTSLSFDTEFYNQIIYSDLADVCSQTLHPPLNTQHLVELSHRVGFLFQVQHISEVGVSNQAILDSLRDKGKESEIPRKMLRLELSDGVQSLYAFETKRVNGISLLSPLGLKVLINDVTVRRGMVEISPFNFTVIGGSVEALNELSPIDRIIKNSRESLQLPMLEVSESSKAIETVSEAAPQASNQNTHTTSPEPRIDQTSQRDSKAFVADPSMQVEEEDYDPAIFSCYPNDSDYYDSEDAYDVDFVLDDEVMKATDSNLQRDIKLTVEDDIWPPRKTEVRPDLSSQDFVPSPSIIDLEKPSVKLEVNSSPVRTRKKAQAIIFSSDDDSSQELIPKSKKIKGEIRRDGEEFSIRGEVVSVGMIHLSPGYSMDISIANPHKLTAKLHSDFITEKVGMPVESFRKLSNVDKTQATFIISNFIRSLKTYRGLFRIKFDTDSFVILNMGV